MPIISGVGFRRGFEIQGQTFPYVVATSDPYERTQIERVKP